MYINQVATTSYLAQQGYLVMYLLMIVEGPVITFLAALGASIGYFNIYVVFILSILGDLTADIITYAIGALGYTLIKKHTKSKLFSSINISQIQNALSKHPATMLCIIKITPPITLAGLITAGATKKLPFRIFFFYTAVITFCLSVLTILLGYYSGIPVKYFASFLQTYQLISLIIVLAIAFLLLYKKSLSHLHKKIHDLL